MSEPVFAKAPSGTPARPRRRLAPRIHPDALLLSFAEAGVLLGEPRSEVIRLVMIGKLTPHPDLADKIARAEVERFCSYSGITHAESDPSQGRPVHDSTPEKSWDVPNMRL